MNSIELAVGVKVPSYLAGFVAFTQRNRLRQTTEPSARVTGRSVPLIASTTNSLPMNRDTRTTVPTDMMARTAIEVSEKARSAENWPLSIGSNPAMRIESFTPLSPTAGSGRLLPGEGGGIRANTAGIVIVISWQSSRRPHVSINTLPPRRQTRRASQRARTRLLENWKELMPTTISKLSFEKGRSSISPTSMRAPGRRSRATATRFSDASIPAILAPCLRAMTSAPPAPQPTSSSFAPGFMQA